MKRSNYFWGLFLILIAFILFGQIFNFFSFGPNLVNLILSIALIALSIANMPRLNFFGIVFPLAAAIILNGRYFNVESQTWPILWASFFLSAGLSVLFKRRKTHGKNHFTYTSSSDDTYQEGSYTEHNEENLNAEFVQINATFADRTRYVRSQNLRGAHIDNTMGALRVYFNEATFNENGCRITVSCTMGQVILYVPRSVNINNQINNTLASVNDQQQGYNPEGLSVLVDGEVTLGEVKIVYL